MLHKKIAAAKGSYGENILKNFILFTYNVKLKRSEKDIWNFLISLKKNFFSLITKYCSFNYLQYVFIYLTTFIKQ